MEALLLLLLFPLAWPFIAKRIWHDSINWTEMTIQIVLVTTVTTGVWFAGQYGQTRDTEIWNGKVTGKEIVDGYYQTSYSCPPCTQTCSGSGSSRSCTETCSTCYTDHYTRSWDGHTTVGDVRFDYLDTEWRSRRDSAGPPERYNICKIGEPASIEHSYTNYVQAVPESLFHDDSSMAEQFAGKIPAYPKVYDFYRLDRVLAGNTSYPYTKELNDSLNNTLRELGAIKQANIIVIMTEVDDPSYRYAVENAWLGGEKNDIVVFIGLDDLAVTWVDVMTWALNAGNEMFHVSLRDDIKALGSVESMENLSSAVVKNVKGLYDRPHMEDYEYLKDEIDPPLWVIILSIIIAVGGSVGLTFVFHKHEVDDIIGDLFRGRKSNRRYR